MIIVTLAISFLDCHIRRAIRNFVTGFPFRLLRSLIDRNDCADLSANSGPSRDRVISQLSRTVFIKRILIRSIVADSRKPLTTRLARSLSLHGTHTLI